MAVNGFFTMRARRAGNCTRCGGAIIPGEQMGWKRDGQLTRCFRCLEVERRIQAERRHQMYLESMRIA